MKQHLLQGVHKSRESRPIRYSQVSSTSKILTLYTATHSNFCEFVSVHILKTFDGRTRSTLKSTDKSQTKTKMMYETGLFL